MSLNIHEQDLGDGEQIEESCISPQKITEKKITDLFREISERMRNNLG